MAQEVNLINQVIRVSGITSANNFVLPANCFIDRILVQETAGNAITGGLSIGTTLAAIDVVAALTVGASTLTWVADASILKRWWATSQQLFLGAITLWNSANITVSVYYLNNNIAA